MRLDVDEKTGQLTVASADKVARILRAAATVERLLVATGQLDSTESVAEALKQHVATIAGGDDHDADH